ncbi:MAG: anti-sigma factor antagonist [Acidimicrobiaceae bacterium]|jgi:anti-sigma B factor antagonist
MTSLSVTSEIGETATTAIVAGEIDISNASRLRSELDQVAARDVGLIVDLAGVTYLDSSGIGELFALAARLTARGGTLALVVPDGSPLRRLLRITQFQEAAPVCASRDAAAQIVSPRTREC